MKNLVKTRSDETERQGSGESWSHELKKADAPVETGSHKAEMVTFQIVCNEEKVKALVQEVSVEAEVNTLIQTEIDEGEMEASVQSKSGEADVKAVTQTGSEI